jgi:hypothetical protein
MDPTIAFFWFVCGCLVGSSGVTIVMLHRWNKAVELVTHRLKHGLEAENPGKAGV